MQEVKTTGEVVLTDSATQEDVLRAMEDRLTAQVHVYKPDEVVTLASGTRYRIGKHGEWIRLP